MNGRRSFLKLFGAGVAAVPVIAKAAEVASAPTAIKAAETFEMPPMPKYRNFMGPDPMCVTSSASAAFYLAQPLIVRGAYGRAQS